MIDEYDICLIGMGPSGMGMLDKLIDDGYKGSVICIDAGESVEKRQCNYLKSNICNKCTICKMITGVGGCALLSSGKFSDYPAGSKLNVILGSEDNAKKAMQIALSKIEKELYLKKVVLDKSRVIKEHEKFKQDNIEYKYYDVYQFDHIAFKKMIMEKYNKYLNLGIIIYLNEFVENIEKDKDIYRIDLANKSIYAKKVVLAVGKYGESLLTNIDKELMLGGKNNFVDIGIRMEYPSAFTEKIEEMHGDLKLKYKSARTYCFSPKGKVARYCIGTHFYTEGYSNYLECTQMSNIAVLLRVEPSDLQYYNILDWIYNKIDTGISCLSLDDFLKGNSNISSECRDLYSNDLADGIREFTKMLANTIFENFDSSQVRIYMPEVDIIQKKYTCNSKFMITEGLYIIGSCTGMFRGILQSYASGMICAEGLMEETHET